MCNSSDILQVLCNYSNEGIVWYSLRISGPQRFLSLQKLIGWSSPNKLSKALETLVNDKIVDKIGLKYRALEKPFTIEINSKY